MYYRVAIQPTISSCWRWKSDMLNSLETLLRVLRIYRPLPQDHLRVFSCDSREDMNEQLARENNGMGSTSVTAEQFLHERLIDTGSAAHKVTQVGASSYRTVRSIGVATQPNPGEQIMEPDRRHENAASPLEKRRIELERGPGGDHDLPYTFALPESWPQVLAWMKLLAKVHNGELAL